MSADSAVTYTSVHSEARSWSIPSEDPYEEAAQQLLERQATTFSEPGITYRDQTLRYYERRILTALELVNSEWSVTSFKDVLHRESSEFCTRHHDAQTDRAAVRAEIEGHGVTVLVTYARRHEWAAAQACRDDIDIQLFSCYPGLGGWA
ncbi:hypothetical protein Tco_1121523 [Tanacetum coccineum]|uniref:Uncharacterized protein n=1 Tax=Tanacetum coccineum TaxID=301880 RepID=A0ABQ5IXY2_9ASTR